MNVGTIKKEILNFVVIMDVNVFFTTYPIALVKANWVMHFIKSI
jgi:hypothetical protein